MFNNITKGKSYDLVLTAVIKLITRIVFILVDIIIFLLQWFYDKRCAMFAFKSWKISISRKIPGYGKFTHPRFIQGHIHYLIPGLTYPGKFLYPRKYSIRKSA